MTGGRGTLSRVPQSLRVLLIVAVVIFAALAIRKRAVDKNASPPQTGPTANSAALQIAKSALDQTVDALSGNPEWRDGFGTTVLEDGVFEVDVFDNGDDNHGADDPNIPRGCVRIVATACSRNDTVSIEGFWAKRIDPFTHALLASNEIRIGPSEDKSCVVIGDVFNNAAQGGSLELKNGASVYGNLTGAGPVRLGEAQSRSAAIVYGRVSAGDITIEETGEILNFEDLSELEAGFDLDFDGETNNIFVSKTQGTLSATHSAVSRGTPVMDGETNFQIARGANPIHVGTAGPGAVTYPLPDFAVFYEMTTGSTAYPPSSDHVTTPIPGDGDGHYFGSEKAFIKWIHQCYPVNVVCWRCAGDSRIDPDDATRCPGCLATGRQSAVEIVGVFYIDDAVLDLSELDTNLIVHGTVVIAQGDPHGWPRKIVGGTGSIDRFPTAGTLIVGGPKRKHFTQTYRSSHKGASYLRYRRSLRSDGDEQKIPFPATNLGRPLREFPGLLAASRIEIKPRAVGFASYRGDIGEESMTIIQGIVFAGDLVRFDGRGGWAGEPVVFDEESALADDDSFDESTLDIDLNDDGDRFDIVDTIDITTRPVVPLSRGRSNVDINNDGVLSQVVLGSSYAGFFLENGYALPVLIYHEGSIVAQAIDMTGACVITFDPRITESEMPVGFKNDSTASPRGLVTWRTIPQR